MSETALKCHSCFLAAAPKVSQSQVHTGNAVSKPFQAVGGHPAPESGQTHLHVRVGLRVNRLSCIRLTPPPFALAGAILPLALGIVITALLLLMIGCRLRLVRHKLKKARPLTTEESDYLINGMYL